MGTIDTDEYCVLVRITVYILLPCCLLPCPCAFQCPYRESWPLKRAWKNSDMNVNVDTDTDTPTDTETKTGHGHEQLERTSYKSLRTLKEL